MTSKLLAADWEKSIWNGNRWGIGGGATISSLNIWERSVKLELLNCFVLQYYLLYLLSVKMCLELHITKQSFVSEFCVLTCSLLIVDFEMACSFIFHLSCKWFWVGSLPRQLLGSSLIIIIMGYAFLPTCLHFARTLKILADILPVI